MLQNIKTALIIGASGLVGGELLNYLLNSSKYEKVTILVRKLLEVKHPKLIQKVIDFDELTNYKEDFKVNDVFCTLGTTIKKAKSKEAFKKVDYEYPVQAAKLAKESGAEKFLIVTSIGANPESIFFYSKVKGQVENKIKQIGIKSLYIFRPSLLLGKRKEFRFGEEMATIFSRPMSLIFKGPLKKYQAIEGKAVAQAMYNAAQHYKEGTYVYESDGIANISTAISSGG